MHDRFSALVVNFRTHNLNCIILLYGQKKKTKENKSRDIVE